MRGLELLQRNGPNAHFGSGGFLIYSAALRAKLAWSWPWRRQCGDAISLQELLDQRLRGRSRRALKAHISVSSETCLRLR